MKSNRLMWSTPFWGVVRYEFKMQTRRKALWIALGLACSLALLGGPVLGNRKMDWYQAAYGLQLLVPLIVGYFLSDRLYRDRQLKTAELIRVSNLGSRSYLWGKLLGTVGATTLVAGLIIIILTLILVGGGMTARNENFFSLLMAVPLMALPAYFFVGAYSLALPILLPLRLYQILFSCYWLWSFQSRVPSVSGTPLSPIGEYSVMGFFRDHFRQTIEPISAENSNQWSSSGYYLSPGPFDTVFEVSPAMAVLNIAILLGLALLVMFAIKRYLAWQEARS